MAALLEMEECKGPLSVYFCDAEASDATISGDISLGREDQNSNFEVCGVCNGSGKLLLDICPLCDGLPGMSPDNVIAESREKIDCQVAIGVKVMLRGLPFRAIPSEILNFWVTAR